ncbi:hypothetical protein LptCag_2196 [Leptospirillum ferriphilum]|uniref:Uncharacterized protein n=1 Tax=Leptospirillum ferriphilum TaxID=178606 RepID=A0A094YNE5_9BACT|nr:hypothetical protein LptCag_2196 [Leptospirillum ferriphilum]
MQKKSGNRFISRVLVEAGHDEFWKNEKQIFKETGCSDYS